MELRTAPHTMYAKELEGKGTEYRLFIDDFLHLGEDLHDILNTLHEAGPNDILEARINSSGGFSRYGQQLINVMGDKLEGRVTTIIESEALSIAAVVFLAGDIRIVYPHSELMFHDMSLSTDGKANEAIKRLTVVHRIFGSYLRTMLGDFFTEEEVQNIINGVDRSLDTKEMCERGIATHVMVSGEPIPANLFMGVSKLRG